LTNGRHIGAGSGTQSAGLMVGGWGPGSIDKTEEFSTVFQITPE